MRSCFKKFAASIVAAAMITATFTACSHGEHQEETTSASSETTVTTEEEQVEELTLENLTDEQKTQVVRYLRGERDKAGSPIFVDNLMTGFFTPVSPDEYKVAFQAFEQPLFRKSSCESSRNRNYPNELYDTMYELNQQGTSVITTLAEGRDISDFETILKLSLDENLVPTIEDITTSYTVNNLTVNAFVRKNEDGYEAVIDPADMENIPVPTTILGIGCDINGIDVLFDSILFTADEVQGADIGEGYSYVNITLDTLTVSADIDNIGTSVSEEIKGNNLSHTTKITVNEVLCGDASKMLDETPLIEKFSNADNGSAMVYNALAGNADMFMEDDVVGVTLLDFDFNGTPELCVAHWFVDYGMDTIYGSDVDIYTISESGLNYVDTLHTYHQGDCSVKLKYNDNMEKEWFFHSRYCTDCGEEHKWCSENPSYQITFDGEGFDYEEIFSWVITEYKEGSDGATDYDFFFKGEKINIQENDGVCSWNGLTYTADKLYTGWKFGLIDVIYDWYLQDVTDTHSFYSDWLADRNSYEVTKLPVQESFLPYYLAQTVDEYYR